MTNAAFKQFLLSQGWVCEWRASITGKGLADYFFKTTDDCL